MKVSICTSVLNQSNYLKRMIESVRKQSLEDWELIIVDDGSSEDIAALVAGFSDERIRVHRFPENKGIPHGLNWALAHAQGEYVQPLSADEWIWEDKLRLQVEYLDTHPETGCVWGLPTPNVGQQWPLGPFPTWMQFQQRAQDRSNEAWVRTLLSLDNIPIGGASMLMRTSVVEEIGLLDPTIFGPSDLEWFVRFFKTKHKGHIMPYRFADAEHPPERLTAPSPEKAERFKQDMEYVRAKHPLPMPSVTGKVTIGIPNFNMAQWVGKAIQSALDQTYGNLEIIVLDDASTDNSAEVIGGFRDSRIKFFQFDENRGTVAAINHMAGSAGGEFYISLAADDLIEPTFVERCLAEFARDPWLEFVASQTDFINEAGEEYKDVHPFKTITRACNKSREVWLNQLYYGNQYFGVGMYRRNVLIELGGWDASHGVLTDYEMYLRLLQRENIHIIEENLTHTRIHAENKSLLSKEEGRKLKQRYHDAKLPYYQPRRKVIIATPFYEMRGFSPYIASLVQTVQHLSALGIEHEFWELSGDSYVDRAKNTLFMRFVEDPDATDLFMIDSDMQWESATFVKMLLLPEEIIMGSYPQKNAWGVFTARPELVEQDGKTHPVGRFLDDGSALLKASYLAGGFIRIKREAVIKYKEHYKDYVYYDHGADPSYPERLYTEFFTCERRMSSDGMSLRWGEDRVFGLRMKDIGIESWIYPKANFGHYGIKGWTGNFHDYLTLPAEQQHPQQ